MGAATDVECELVGLIDFVQSGLLTPSLRKRLEQFSESDLKMALRDLLDWLSLRAILRGRCASLGGRVHPLTGRILARLVLGEYLCAPDGRLAYRVEVPAETRDLLEDSVKERIWRSASGRRHIGQPA